MNTVYNSLTFYDSIDKVDVNRTKAVIPVHCPRHQLPPFIINLGSDVIATVDTIELVGSTTVDITSYFPTLPEVYTDATLGDYIQYKGDTLNSLLPLGLFYLKITADDYIYYSDYIMIDNIYENLIHSWANMGSPYALETLQSSRTTILNYVNSSGSGACISDSFNVRKGESINIVLNVTYSSGTLPQLLLTNSNWTIDTGQTLVDGLNSITLTPTWTGIAYIRIYAFAITSTIHTSEVFVFRQYSSRFCKLKFTNDDNVGKLLYADYFYQEVWLEAILNNPSHEITTVGEEKDGVFISEKIVSKYLYSIIAYVSRAMYSCLLRLPQHDTITITDECGDTYTPDEGNIVVEQPEWVNYDTAKVTLRFNNGSNSQFAWTKTSIKQSRQALYSRNTDKVECGGYFTLSDTYDLGFYSEVGRSLMGLSNINRIRQTGSLLGLQLYFDKTHADAAYFDVWRKDGATYDRIHHVSVLSKLSTGANDITFDIPLAVLEGDWMGISGKRDSDDYSQFAGLEGAGYGKLKYINSYASDLNFGWDTTPLELADSTVSMKVKCQAPLIVGIGDSIMAGHPSHYSFIENSETFSLLNQVLAQLKVLDSRFVYQNMGIGSQTTTDISARFADDVVNLKPRFACINGGVNDIAGGVITKSTFLANFTAILDACATAGIAPIVLKILPWNGTNTQMQATDDWMSDLQTLVATYANSIWVDFDSSMGQFRVGGDSGNLWDLKAAYDSGDNIHPNLAGYTKMAELIMIEIGKKYIL